MREDGKPRRYPNGHFTFRHETADGETSTRTIPYSDVTLNQLVEELEMFINGLGYSPIHLEWEYVSERAERYYLTDDRVEARYAQCKEDV